MERQCIHIFHQSKSLASADISARPLFLMWARCCRLIRRRNSFWMRRFSSLFRRSLTSSRPMTVWEAVFLFVCYNENEQLEAVLMSWGKLECCNPYKSRSYGVCCPPNFIDFAFNSGGDIKEPCSVGNAANNLLIHGEQWNDNHEAENDPVIIL